MPTSDGPAAPMLLRTEDLSAGYGGLNVLWSVSLEVREQEIVTVIGPNGAGKTTLVRAITGLNEARTGTVEFAGRAVAGLKPDARARLGLCLCPEGRALFGTMSVADNLLAGAIGVGLRGAALHERLEEIYALFPRVGDRLRQRADTMSGGEQQMLAIARALMAGPRLLMLDEPSLGLGPQIIDEVFAAVRGIRGRGTSVLLIEQNVEQALRLADRGYLLEGGVIRQADSAGALLEHPDIRETFLGGP